MDLLASLRGDTLDETCMGRLGFDEEKKGVGRGGVVTEHGMTNRLMHYWANGMDLVWIGVAQGPTGCQG